METSSITIDPWRIDHASLRFELTPDRVEVIALLSVVSQGDVGEALVLDGAGLETLEVSVDGRVLSADEYQLGDRTLTLPLAPGSYQVGTRVAVVPAVPHHKGIISGPTLLFTDCEPQGFRRITWFLDRPSNRATFDVTMVAHPSEFPTMLSNGLRVDEGELPDGRHWVRFDDPITKPSYLFSMVAGELAVWTRPRISASGRELEISVAASRETVEGADFALGMLAKVMEFDEANGGIEHDLDGLTLVAVPGYSDATEYHGLMFFEPSLLVVDRRGFVDDDLLLIAANVAHEYGHHVRGNRITVSSWGQLTLKEGLTVLQGQNDFRRHWLGDAARVLDVLDMRRLQFPEEITIGAPPLRGEVSDPTALYNRTTYLKGAEIFGMIRTLLGPDTWRTVFATFVERHDLGSVGVAEFLAVARECDPGRAAEIDGIARWFTRVGRPSLAVTPVANSVTIARTDSLSDDPPVAMPVVLAFFAADDGEQLHVSIDGGAPAAEHTVVLAGRDRTVEVEADRPFVVSPLRRFSAPVDLAVAVPAESLAVLVEHDNDPFARWWAGQELMIRVVDAVRDGKEAEAEHTLDVLAAALRPVTTSATDPILLANMLALPDEFMLGDRDVQIDVDGVSNGLDVLRFELGRRLHDDVLAVMDRFDDDVKTGEEARDIAIRWLVEPALALLLATGSDEAAELAMAQLGSLNSTRAVRALTQLAHYDEVPLDDLLAATYENWQHSPKLVDRWLRAQSGSRRSDTVQRVAALAAGPLYDRSDRARVMAVWFPFATRNRSVFHSASGEGYRTFVDELGVLMPTNAGLAVRLVGDLLQFQRFDPARRTLLRAELARLADMEGMPDFAVSIVRGLLA